MTPIPLLGLLFASQVPTDFIPVDWRSLPRRTIQGPLAARAAATGPRVLKIVVVPMRYADQDSTYASDTLSRVFNGPYPFVTVNQYFAEQSKGQFQVEAKVIPWQKLSLTKAQATALPLIALQRRFRNEAAAAASREGLTLADYDFNGDSMLDGLMVMYAGKSAQESGISQDMGNAVVTQASAYDTTVGGLTVRQNVFISEVRNDRPSTPGPIAHELSHVIGASDTYDADVTLYGKTGGLGYWDLMSSGSHGLGYNTSYPNRQGSFKPTGMSTWVKEDIGFISPSWVDSAQEIRIKPGESVKVWADPLRTRQFLYLENRNRAGVDSVLPGPGLFVTRVRTSKMLEMSNGIAYAVNDDTAELGVELLEASGEQRVGVHADYTPMLKDLFGGSVDSLSDAGPVSLKLPDNTPSEASLHRVRMDGSDVLVQVTPSPNRGYSLTGRIGRVKLSLAQYPNTQYIYGFRCPTDGKVSALRLARPQNTGTNQIQIWKTLSEIPSGGTPVVSVTSGAGTKSTGYQYSWTNLPSPISVKAGDTVFVAQKVGTDSLSRLLATNFDPAPANSPCWYYIPGNSKVTSSATWCPIVDLVIEHEGGTSSVQPLVAPRRFQARLATQNLSIEGARPGEVLQLRSRDLRGRTLWSGTLTCDAIGSGKQRLEHNHRGLQILEVIGASGSQTVTGMAP